MLLQRRQFVAMLMAARATYGATSNHGARMVKQFRSPDGHPNALETVPEGFWIGEQTTDRAYLMTHQGKVLRAVQTESSNTSGIAFGNGSLWMAANGKAIGRAPRATDATTGEVVQADPHTGKTIARHAVPGGGGVHGLEFAEGKLWVTSLALKKLSLMDPKTWEVIHQIPVHLDRAHGLAYDPPGIWVMHSTDRVIHKLDTKDGRILEQIALTPEDPDPHGMSMYNGHLYYCDAGIAPGGKGTGSPNAGYVFRVDKT